MPHTQKRREQLRLIEWLEKPLLGLAFLSVVLYLLTLDGFVSNKNATVAVLSAVIDAAMLADLLFKLRVMGVPYLRSPWFVIDLLSCLPILGLLGNGLRMLRVVRFVRTLRALRILRVARALKALRLVPTFQGLFHVTNQPQQEGSSPAGMVGGILALTLLILLVNLEIRRTVEHSYVDELQHQLDQGVSWDEVEHMGGHRTKTEDGSIELRGKLAGGQAITVYFDRDQVDTRADQVEFFVIIGMLLTMGLVVYIITRHHQDVTHAQIRTLLNVALPRQVAEQFLRDPTTYNTKSRMPATILFMDFVGFTSTCESLSDSPDVLSHHLEQAMDSVIDVLAKHDLIIDKFIGDAIMSFRGGPLVFGSPEEHAYRSVKSALESAKALASLDDPYFHKIKIGGASAADCLIGAFGTSARLSYTILGDGVNLAARLEPASAQCGTGNLFCAQTHLLCTGHNDLIWRRWGQIKVSGKGEPQTVYECFEREEREDWSFLDEFHAGLDAFHVGDVFRAKDHFLRAETLREGVDRPSRIYLEWCDRILGGESKTDWKPVMETKK